MKKLSYLLTNRQTKIYLFCLFTAAALITLFSRSSFLYPFNNWADTNVYMTIGREMLRGAVPYRDLFDHKGILWYFLYMAANLISQETFLGLYLIEILSFSIFLFYSWKLLDMFCPSFYAMAVLPILGCLITVSDAFGMGGSAEEIHLSLAAAGLYYLIRFIRDTDFEPPLFRGSHAHFQKQFPVLYLNGIFAGCVLWSKYSLLGFWFIWMASVFFILVFRKEWKRGLVSCLVFLLGMATVSIPCLLYLLATSSLFDFLDTYIVINLRYAGGAQPQSPAALLQNSLHYFLMMFGWNKILGTLTLTGLAAVTVFPVCVKASAKRLILPVLFLCAAGVEFMGKVSHFYYFMTVAPFLVLFFLAAGVLPLYARQIFLTHSITLQTLTQKKATGFFINRPAGRKAFQAAVCLFLLALSCIYGWHRSPNVPYMRYDREDLTQYQAAAVIDRQEHPTLMYYHNLLDTGILMASENARPWGKYYFMPNIAYETWPVIHDAQEEGIRNREADFVFTYQYGTETLRQNYHLVKYFPSSEKDHGDSYLLMQANPYDLYTTCRLEFQEDGSFSCTSGEISWTDQGDENAWVLVGTPNHPVLAENVTVIAPDGRTPDIYLYVSTDGENWISENIRTEFDELSLSFQAEKIRYIKLIAARNQTVNGLWQLMVYEPTGTGRQPDEGEP